MQSGARHDGRRNARLHRYQGAYPGCCCKSGAEIFIISSERMVRGWSSGVGAVSLDGCEYQLANRSNCLTYYLFDLISRRTPWLLEKMPSVLSNEIQGVAARAQTGVLDAIPKKWRLSSAQLELVEDANVMDIPLTCGILTPEQIAITEQTATELLSKLAAGKLSSVEVTEAFCARAAIAHQLVRIISHFEIQVLMAASRQTASWNFFRKRLCRQQHRWTST